MCIYSINLCSIHLRGMNLCTSLLYGGSYYAHLYADTQIHYIRYSVVDTGQPYHLLIVTLAQPQYWTRLTHHIRYVVRS